jgi:hypothetical protein
LDEITDLYLVCKIGDFFDFSDFIRFTKLCKGNSGLVFPNKSIDRVLIEGGFPFEMDSKGRIRTPIRTPGLERRLSKMRKIKLTIHLSDGTIVEITVTPP